MSTVIIIAGTGRARAAIENANSTASQNGWTQAQKDNAAAMLNDFADALDNFTKAPQPPA